MKVGFVLKSGLYSITGKWVLSQKRDNDSWAYTFELLKWSTLEYSYVESSASYRMESFKVYTENITHNHQSEQLILLHRIIQSVHWSYHIEPFKEDWSSYIKPFYE